MKSLSLIAIVSLLLVAACGGGEEPGTGPTPRRRGEPRGRGQLRDPRQEPQISTVPTSAITGNIGVSPAAATFITGFSLTADVTNMFSTSPQVTGKVYAADYTSPTSVQPDHGGRRHGASRSPTPPGARPTSPSSAPGTSAG